MDTFGERLAKLRTDKGYSQAELAKRLNIAKSTLAMYETGKREPGFDVIERISKFFDVKTDYLLLGRDGVSKPSSATLTLKDEKDIAAELERLVKHLESTESLAFSGEPDPEDIEEMETLRASLETSLRLAKRIAKKKFTPKKYRK